MSTTTRPLLHVRSADGTRLAVEEAGDPAGTPVILLHGIAQSRHTWRSVLDGMLPRSGDIRLLAPDLRGHGDSEAPPEPEAYGPGKLGEDLRAIVETLDHPVVVASSYAGVAVGDYLRAFGGDALGGVVLVAASTSTGRSSRQFFGPGMMDNARALLSEDPAVYEAGARAFLPACAASPLPRSFVEDSVARMLRVPSRVRRALLARDEDFTAELAQCSAPIALLHGLADSVVLPALSRRVAAVRPDARLTVLPDIGHLPWLEAPAAFDTFLGDWVRDVARRA